MRTGKVVIVTEDIPATAVRSVQTLVSNRVDKIDAPVNSIIWIMKDPKSFLRS